MYDELREKVSILVKSAMFMALTTDCWTSRAGDSYISITSHFIDDKYNWQMAVLNTFPLYKRYSAQNLLSKILYILEGWQEESYLFYKANITTAVQEGGFTHIGCVDHTLQLVINGVLKGETMTELLKTVRAIVGHFHRSSAAHLLLSGVQTQLQLPVHHLSQEVCTQWNSTFYNYYVRKISWTVACNHHCSTRYNLFCRTQYNLMEYG